MGLTLLMVGPSGSGKSMLAARLSGILPPLEPAEALELGMIQSVAGGLRGGGLLRERPFRDPHIPLRSRRWSAAGSGCGRARSASPTRASSFSTNFRSSAVLGSRLTQIFSFRFLIGFLILTQRSISQRNQLGSPLAFCAKMRPTTIDSVRIISIYYIL
jgi:energy-coupling factor transporter ATP-binding protein EcfA2